jgi:hypothetical protein
MNSNDMANLFNQVGGSATKSMEGVLSHLIGGMFFGVMVGWLVFSPMLR